MELLERSEKSVQSVPLKNHHENNNMIFNIETTVAMPYSNHLVKVELAYLPITLFDEVSDTCRNTVNGSCMLRIICEMIRP